jgi:phosphate acetyltransferase
VRSANKRIVLPEGSEPLTVQAAAICQARGIARCVLLAKPADVEAVARAQGIELPPGLEILDPDLIRERYVEPMVALRKSKSLNAPMAEQQLEDTVVIGTMMLALDEVDGLVSGVIHSTANTIRPALQLIKTAPGCTWCRRCSSCCSRRGAGVWRLRDEPAPERRRTGRDRPAKRRLGRRVRHHPAWR